MTETVRAIPEGYHTVTPYLIAEDTDALIEFLERGLGATVIERHVGPDGRLMHASIQLGDSKLMMGQATGEWRALPTMLHLYVDDTDALFRQAVAAGARAIREPEDQFYGDRSAGVVDLAGNQWWISTHVEDVSPEEMERRMAAQAGADGSGG